MSSFPLLKLPYVAQIHVLKVINEDDLLVFSFISRRSKNLAMAARRSITGKKWELCSQSRRRSIEQLQWTLCSKFRFNFLSYSEVHEVKFGMEEQLKEEGRQSGKLEFWKLNGQLIAVYRKKDNKYWVPWTWYIGELANSEEHNYELMIQYSEHILEVFQVQNFHYSSSNLDPPQDLFVLRHTRQFKSLEFDNYDPMPAEDLKFVLEELEVESFTINRSVPDFHWDGPLRMEELRSYQTEWLAFESILNCECKHVVMSHNDLTDVQFNTFIKKWLDGGLQNLEYFIVLSDNLGSSEVIFQGIQTIPYHADRHPEKHPRDDGLLQELQESSVDVRRSDGTLATILISPESQFVMAVWNGV